MPSLRRLTGGSATPPEVVVSALVAAGGGALFVLTALLRWYADGDAGFLTLPLGVLVLELLVAGGLLARFRPARLTGVVLFAVLALLHLLIVLAAAPWWVRLVSGVLCAAHVYGVVLLNLAPARAHLGGRE
jgi:hypothetical protein